MALKEEFEKTGNWLFRWRCYLPLGLFTVILLAMGARNYALSTHPWSDAWQFGCFVVSLFGLGIRVYTAGHAPGGTSGRNTRRQRAARLNTTGLYSLVRHPLYLGNFFIWLGVSMFARTWWVCVIFVLSFWLYYERIMFAEEHYLRSKFGRAYEDWASKTPAFLPKFSNWTPAALPFSLRTVLRREYSGLFAIIASFTLLEVINNLYVEGRLRLDFSWAVLFSVGLAVYVTLRMLKKSTNLLRVAGR